MINAGFTITHLHVIMIPQAFLVFVFIHTLAAGWWCFCSLLGAFPK